MSLKLFLFLVPVALGGYYVANRAATADDGAGTATAGRASPARLTIPECVEMQRRRVEIFYFDPAPDRATAMQRLGALRMELAARGCPPGIGEPIDASRLVIGAAPPRAEEAVALNNSAEASGGARSEGPSFEPGRPMVDVSSTRAR